MGKSKPTKVPVMKKSQAYRDWKKELEVWEATNTALDVEKKIQAGTLFESLEGIQRQTVLSELSVIEITADEGVKNIIKTLDNFFLGNETQNAYTAMDDLMKYKCDPDMSMENFIVEFQLKVNKVKVSGTNLSDGVLGYTLLNCANLPEDKHDMIKATCNELSYKNVKAQLEKVGFRKSNGQKFKFSGSSEPDTSKVKVESCYFGDQHSHDYSGNSSDDDLNGERVYFGSKKSSFSGGNQNYNRTFKLNPTDRFGFIRTCTYCKCAYHWLIDCPYAPNSVKSNLSNKSGKNNFNKSL